MFSEAIPHLTEYELLLFLSPEARCIYGLDEANSVGKIRRVWRVEYSDYDQEQPRDISEEDRKAVEQYKNNRFALDHWVESRAVRSERILHQMDCEEPFDREFGPPTPFELPLLVDISCAPRGRLLALLHYLCRCQEKSGQVVHLLYSMASKQAPGEAAYSYGIVDVSVVPGFSGQIRLRQDALILVLGFEGNRALSLYRRLMPNKTVLIVGDSGDEEREFYIRNTEVNNHSLLSIHGNTKLTMPSRDPVLFAKALNDCLETQASLLKERYNIYLSCLGTKLQTLGAFWVLRAHPVVQVLDTLPTRRRIASEGKGRILFADLGTSGLLRNVHDL
jgi:hypothetical protein